jgi:hypothetical protein
MAVTLPIRLNCGRGIPDKVLRRWARERLRQEPQPDGGLIYSFHLTGSTCTNMDLEVLMTVTVDVAGRIRDAVARPAGADSRCDAMCAAQGNGERFFGEVGRCEEALGLTLHEAAFREWAHEPSGCFCTAGNRRHKWRNVFQALRYAADNEPMLDRCEGNSP